MSRTCCPPPLPLRLPQHFLLPLPLLLPGILEGVARIESDAYRLLHRLGASPVREVLTAGGGAHNEAWTAIRAAALGVPVRAAANGAPTMLCWHSSNYSSLSSGMAR